MNEQDLAEKIFGQVAVSGNKNFTMQVEDALAEFENKDSVSRLFCENCGMYVELDEADAKKVASLAGTVLNKDSKGYFKANGCMFCGIIPEKVEYQKITIQ